MAAMVIIRRSTVSNLPAPVEEFSGRVAGRGDSTTGSVGTEKLLVEVSWISGGAVNSGTTGSVSSTWSLL